MTPELEVAPISWLNPGSEFPLLLVCEHAGCVVPAALRGLGVPEAVLRDHTGWDIGALGVAKGLAARTGAELIYQNISRLVIDCNRPLQSHELIPEVSEHVRIPGNIGIGASERKWRIEAVWMPFQNAVARSLHRRAAQGRSVALVAVHSFSPVYAGVPRPHHLCLAYNRDDRLAKLLHEHFETALPGHRVGLNEPFFVADDDDQTIPVFGESRGIPHVLLEIRNDLLRDESQQDEWAAHVADGLLTCLKCLVP